jgi:ubiquinone/menaquinone biosynthesis C-methylase UbiE
MTGSTGSTRWQTVNSNPGEIAEFLKTATRLVGVMKRKSIDALRLTAGGSALEVGCGLGRDSETMLQIVGPTARIVGLDGSEALIAKAIERTRAAGLPLEFRVGSALALPFEDNCFDACRTDRVLQHLTDPARAVAEW